jgi:hypothetical protein
MSFRSFFDTVSVLGYSTEKSIPRKERRHKLADSTAKLQTGTNERETPPRSGVFVCAKCDVSVSGHGKNSRAGRRRAA